jgi:hypothetical protein
LVRRAAVVNQLLTVSDAINRFIASISRNVTRFANTSACFREVLSI